MGDEEASAFRPPLVALQADPTGCSSNDRSILDRDARGFILDDTLTALCSLCVQALAPQTALASPGQ